MQRHAPDNVVAVLLLAAMVTALTALVAGAVARFTPGWQPYPLVAACFLVSVEAALVRYRMREGRHLSVGALPYLAAEIFALVVVMRVAASLGVGEAALGEVGVWLREPLAALDDRLAGHLLAGVLCAAAVRLGLRELEALAAAAGPPRTEHALDAEIFRARAEAEERDAVASLAGGMAWGGLIALLALVAQLADLGPWGGAPGPLPPAMGLAGIAYLACGAVLYSRARLGLLSARWRRDEAAVEPAVAPGWTRQSAGIILAIVALGLLLPRSYGLGLVEAARDAAVSATNLVGLAALLIGVLALGLLGLVLALPALLIALVGGMGRTAPPIGPVTPLPPGPRPPAPEVIAERPLAPGVIFWVCVALLAGYALWTVLRRQAWAVAAFARLRAGVLAPVAAWLLRLWGGAAGYARKVGDAVAERLRRPEEPPAPPALARLRLGRLSPGELVRLYYALLLRRADEVHQGRRPAETPSEYGARLGGRLPEAEDDLAHLTDAYLAAAYAPRPTTPDEARAARGLWARLRRRLRR